MMNNVVRIDEKVMATIPEVAASGENELAKSVTDIEFRAESIVILSDDDYKDAADFGRSLKQKMAEVKEFFKPMKDQANKAHKAVCDREKLMLTPLTNAEKMLKGTMGAYSLEQERKRKAIEEELRRKAQAEVERKLAEAIAAEEKGNKEQAESAMLDAQMMDQASRNCSFEVERPKAAGTYTTRDWEIVEINRIEVPISFQGVELRPVDSAAAIRLIRASKGSIQIPGITYKETVKMSFRK